MGKLFFLFAFLCSAAVAFADSDASSSASELIRQNLFKNQEKIQEIAQDLTQDERTALYAEYQKNPAVPFLANLCVGFGIGSFIEGDTTGGTIALACDAWGYIFVFTGAILTLSNSLDLCNFGAGLACFGSVTVVGSRIFETIRSVNFTNKYNSVLKKSLNAFEVYLKLPAKNEFAGLSFSYTKYLN